MLNLGGGDVDTATPMGSMVFTVMAALAQMELEIKRERITDSVAKRRAAGKDLGGRRQTFIDSQVRNAGDSLSADPGVAPRGGVSPGGLHGWHPTLACVCVWPLPETVRLSRGRFFAVTILQSRWCVVVADAANELGQAPLAGHVAVRVSHRLRNSRQGLQGRMVPAHFRSQRLLQLFPGRPRLRGKRT